MATAMAMAIPTVMARAPAKAIAIPKGSGGQGNGSQTTLQTMILSGMTLKSLMPHHNTAAAPIQANIRCSLAANHRRCQLRELAFGYLAMLI